MAPFDASPTPLPQILVELDHMDWLRRTFPPELCRAYTEQVRGMLINQMTPRPEITLLSDDVLCVRPALPMSIADLLDLAQRLSSKLNAACYDLHGTRVQGAGSVSLKDLQDLS